MPVTIYPSTLKIKDTNGTFHGADCIKGDTGPQGIPGNDYVLTTQDKSEIAELVNINKADKVENATAGDIATLDEYGNLVDSGKDLDDITDRAPTIVNSASGAVAAFEDGAEMPVKSLTVGIEPVQDLHGYDNPWPAGGGKNLVNVEGTHTITSQTILADYETTEETTFTVSAHIKNDTSIGVRLHAVISNDSVQVADNVVYVQEQGEGNFSKTFSTAGLTFTKIRVMVNGASSGYSCEVSNVQLEKGSTATAYAPYSNICPISGWTECNIVRTGKNILKLSNTTTPISVTNGTLAITENSIVTRTQTNAVGITSFITQSIMPDIYADYFNPGTYWFGYEIISTDYSSTTLRPEFVYDDGTIVAPNYGSPCVLTKRAKLNRVVSSYTLLPASSVFSARIWMSVDSSTIAYEPYTGSIYPISWQTEAGTIYGGTLDVTNGTLTVDRISKDISTLDFSPSTPASHIFRTDSLVSVIKRPTDNNTLGEVKCDKFSIMAYAPLSASDNGKFAIAATGYPGRVVFIDHRYSTEESFVSGNAGTQLVYALATPITYTLTPQEVTTLLGSNRIWADCGDTAVDYCADTKIYVDNAIPNVPVQDVKVNGTSILNNGVANVPIASTSSPGVVRVGAGLTINASNDLLIDYAIASENKAGTNYRKPITPYIQHAAAFYGLAKAAGDTTQSVSNNAVGTYTDTAKDKIQQMLGVDSLVARHEGATASSGIAVGEPFIFGGKLYSATSAIAEGDAIAPGVNCSETTLAGSAVRDVQVNGTSVVSNGVVDIPYGNDSRLGVVRTNSSLGIGCNTGGVIRINAASLADIKQQVSPYKAITPIHQHESVFYGLAKAAGDTTQSQSDNAVGTYTETAQSKIHEMLDAPVTVSGTDPVITGKAGIRYICGECDTLTLTLPASGIVDVIFTSGTTPTVLSVPNTVKWANNFDPTSLDTSTTYEINILNGTLGVACTWT